MSYRALLTIRDGEQFADFKVIIGEDWDDAEKAAHVAARARSYQGAFAALHHAGAIRYPFDSAESRRDWIDTYGDQTWEVRFEEDGDYVRTTITGKDAGGTDIFMRRTVYYLGVDG